MSLTRAGLGDDKPERLLAFGLPSPERVFYAEPTAPRGQRLGAALPSFAVNRFCSFFNV